MQFQIYELVMDHLEELFPLRFSFSTKDLLRQQSMV